MLVPCAGQGWPPPQHVWYQSAFNDNTFVSYDSSGASSPATSAPAAVSSSLLVGSSSNSGNHSLSHRVRITRNCSGAPGSVCQLQYNLVLPSVQVHQSGRYTCELSNAAGTDQQTTELVVSAPLSVAVHPTRVRSEENAPEVTFNCSISGHPIRKLIWFKNGEPLAVTPRVRFSSNRRQLIVRQVRREDEGVYQCLVHNELDSAQAAGELRLQDEPARLLETFATNLAPLSYGHPLSLKCVAAGSPLPQITWTLDGRPLAEQMRVRVGDYVNADGLVNSFVNISTVRPEDGGWYECSAHNHPNFFSSASIDYSSAILNRHSINSNSHYHHSRAHNHNDNNGHNNNNDVDRDNNESRSHFGDWSGLPIDQNGLLNIWSDAALHSFTGPDNWSDSNAYRSSGSIRSAGRGVATHRARLDVIGPPIVRSMRNRSALAGQNVWLHCSAGGYPIKEIRWFRGTNRLPENHHQTVFVNGSLLIVQAEKLVDEGWYRCEAQGGRAVISISSASSSSNSEQAFDFEHETSSQQLFLSILVAPMLSPFLAPPNLREGMRSMLTCSVLEGDAPFLMRWMKDDQLIGAQLLPPSLTSAGSMGTRFPALGATSNHRYRITYGEEEFSSTLFFTNVSFEDNGNYSCVVSNTVSVTNHTVHMVVKGTHFEGFLSS